MSRTPRQERRRSVAAQALYALGRHRRQCCACQEGIAAGRGMCAAAHELLAAAQAAIQQAVRT